MPTPLKVLLVTRSAAALKAIEASLAGRRGFAVTPRLMSNGHTDPLHGVSGMPDVVVLRFDESHLGELATLAEHDPASRPAVVLVGPVGNADAMRLAIRCGAQDFLPEPLHADDLVGALLRIGDRRRRAGPEDQGTLAVFVGAAGGAGTSLLACNVAHLLAVDARETCLVDLDLRCGTLAHFLDLRPKLGLVRAVEAADTLDAAAIDGFVATHASGLRLMSTGGQELPAEGLASDRVATLLHTLTTTHRHVIVDAPHTLDVHGATACGMANVVFLVVQQSVVQVKNAARLRRVLTDEFGLPEERIRIVLNRASKGAPVSVEDVRLALGGGDLLVVPNHYKPARESIDTGVPVYDVDRNGPLVRAFAELKSVVAGETPAREGRGGLLRRALPGFLRN